MAITDKDIEKLKGTFATKKDLDGFATKKDLDRFATKEDLAEFKGAVITRLDRVMGELEKAREDRVLAKAKDDEQDGRLDRLEAKVGVA
ncbi:hypothetical protein HZC35_02920 [Candidatus Saganbacteria bacterium]|nr:hypothetical protein [Candidatus Saganbacteria bacterium]